MVIKAQVADMVTGERIQTLPTSAVRWEKRIVTPEDVSVTLTLAPRAHQRLDLRNSTVEVKTALIVSDGDRVLGAGPIWTREYSDTSGRLEISAGGLRSLLDKSFVLPDTVTSLPLLVQSGDDEGEPNPAVATTFTGATWPQIVKGLLDQRAARTGGGLPLVYGGTGVGSHDKSYDASAFKSVGEALQDLTKLVDGPEIDFTPRLVNNKLEWVVRVGDDAELEVKSPTVHEFDFTPAKRSVRGLKVRSSGEGMASEAWGAGGRQAAKALFSRASSPRLTDAGFPRMETISSAHSTVVEQSTLDKYTQADLVASSAPVEWWSWEFDSHGRTRISDVSVGDYCVVKLRGNRYLPDGVYTRRIVGMSGDSSSRWVKVTTDEVVTW